VTLTISLAAIAALFLLSRQALARGHNIQINLKVTKLVEGSMVIEKKVARVRATKKAA
jgi:hypothetical protein